MLIGAMKCGTTTLSQILSEHPEISFSRIKEPEYFSQEGDWKTGLEEYHQLFEKGKPLWGEGSTGYTKMPEKAMGIWKKIYDYNPEMKFIYMYRNPIDRLVSQYNHMFKRGYLNESISSAIRNRPSLMNNGRYATQVIPYFETFGRERVLLIDFDDFNSARGKILTEIANFLNVDYRYFEGFEGTHGNNSRENAMGTWRKNKFLAALATFKGLLPKPLKSSIKEKLNRKGLSNLAQITAEEKQLIYDLNRVEIQKWETITAKSLDKWRPDSHITEPNL